ncbi:MAG: rhodanese-like domain-containing protein [Bacteriovoracaceae bacterium]|jgi:rhodanese-related sulfurtransferase|nr:rhodanese-like domain-containing protein [Bacteriovoracaceae bacterium]
MIKSMNVEELKSKLDNGEEILLVDCREQNEWDDGHIPQAQLLPLSEFQSRFSELKEDATIILQCRSGKRSLSACQILLENDYENMTNLEGGILAWIEKGFEITTD